MANFISDWFYGDSQKDAINQAKDAANASAAASASATEKANKENLDFQKILAYLQMQTGNQGNAQSLAAQVAGQQQGLNQYTQLYNQEQQNQLPYRQSSLAALSALGPLMQMTGLQGYQTPTSLNTTPLQSPDVLKQYTSLADYFQKKGTDQMNPEMMLKAFSDPAAFLASVSGQSSPYGVQPQQPTNPPAGGGQWSVPVNGWAPTGTPVKVGGVEYYPGSAEYDLAMKGQLPGAVLPATSGTAMPTGMNVPQAQQMTQLQPLTSQYNALAGNPEYDYLHSQAQRTLANQLSAKGMLGSGAGMKMATDTTLGMARDEQDRRRKQLMDIYGLAMGQMPTGAQQTGSTLANLSNQGGSNLADTFNTAAQNRSGMYSGLANSMGQSALNSGQNLSNLYNAQSNNAYNNLQAKQGVTTGADQLWSLGKAYATGGLSGFGGGTSIGKASLNPLDTRFWGY